MKRLLGLVVALALIIGALSSHSKSSTPTTAASSTPEAAATSTEPTSVQPVASYTRCDQNISAAPHTTCGFANNVFRAFARDVSGGESDAADHEVEAQSPATGHTPSVQCRTSGGDTVCSMSGQARVRFPLWAAQVYYRTPPKPESTPTYEPPPSGVAPEEEPTEPESGEPESYEGETECTSGTYVNAAGNRVCRPEEAPSAPAGATAECEDGTYSFSESRSGTCSHHGGVARWL
ncbi:MAG TPA: DUF3761 domain-containing protein [Solirubrobacteraceae bacterium]|nr:DUF3761 domain-containing protein [Solirubrobacteraceae bacterium]